MMDLDNELLMKEVAPWTAIRVLSGRCMGDGCKSLGRASSSC